VGKSDAGHFIGMSESTSCLPTGGWKKIKVFNYFGIVFVHFTVYNKDKADSIAVK